MKIGLWGYGKMGKQIEEIAIRKGHEICWIIDIQQKDSITDELLQKADVIIEFTAPHAAPDNIRRATDAGIPVVCGSTGWYGQLPEIQAYCLSKNGSLFYSSNFSIGVNIFFKINQTLSILLEKHPEYHISIEEIHHTQKLDAPSGTAITLAEKIAGSHKGYTDWKNEGEEKSDAIPIHSIRTDNVPGTHTLTWKGPNDQIVLTHEAFNRIGFASGAIDAAEWIIGKKGVFNMEDLLA
jgi:4-hydroxy-tetrahydrodipicolinate reductase